MQPDDSTVPPPPLRIGLPPRLGEMLIRQGLVTSADVQLALAEQSAGSEWRLGRLLVRQGALDDRTLVAAIAHQFHVPVVDLRVEPPTPGALAHLTRDAALQLQALPLRLDPDALVVAVADPPVRELRVAVERSTGLPVRLVLAAADDLADALYRFYTLGSDPTLRAPVRKAAERAAGGTSAHGADVGEVPGFWDIPGVAEVAPPARPVPEPTLVAPPPVVSPTSAAATPSEVPEAEVPEADGATDLQIVVWLLSEAVRRDASAVHLDHGEEGLRIRYRVGDTLVPGPNLPRASGTVVCHRLLATARLVLTDDALHEGAFDTVVDGRSFTCRVTAAATASGTHVVVRTEAPVRTARLEDLGVSAADAAGLRGVLREGRGVVVVASMSAAGAAPVCRTLVDEVGPDDHVVVSVLPDDGMTVRGVVVLAAGRAGHTGEAVRTARALGADTLVVESTDTDTVRSAFDAASELLAVVRVHGEDPSDVTAALVESVGAFLVAGMLRAVVVAGREPTLPTAEVHLVTEDLCRAILDLPRG